MLVCEGSLCPKKLSDVSGPGLGEAGRGLAIGEIFESRVDQEEVNNACDLLAVI